MSVAASAIKSVVLTTLVMLGFLLLAALLWLPAEQTREESPEVIARRNAASGAPALEQQPQPVARDGTAQPSPAQTSQFAPLAGGAAAASALAGSSAQPSSPAGRDEGDPFRKPAPTAAWMSAATPQPAANAAQNQQPPAPESAPAQQQYEPSSAPVAEVQQRQPARTPAREPAAQSPAALASELSALGYRVHASLSGSGRATTLSVTGAGLTRQAGTQWLSDPRTRRGLKAAGVSVVVILNGQESWTFML